jgi:WD40 repeat protein
MNDAMPNSREERFNEVLAGYYEQVEVGRSVDRTELLSRYPDLAGELASFFDAKDGFERDVDALLPVTPRAPCFVGEYELREEIGRGGMGVVYRARHARLSRTVALKMIRGGQLASPEDLARFETEAALVAGLDHPHVVPLFEAGVHDGLPYFTMKLVEGSLAARLAAGPLPARQAAALLASVARAVHHAHQRGVLHRDLKPGNILLDESGIPFVTDFGLARRLHDRPTGLTRSNAILGTAGYLSPEQADGQVRHLTTAADVHALGAILYECLTGRPPFQGNSLLDTLRRVRDEEPTRPSSVRSGIDRDLETICCKCLEKEPKKRYDSAGALADDLERWLAGKPIEARPVGTGGQLWRWARRQPVLAGLSALVLALLGTVASGATLAAVSLNDLAWKERQRAGKEREARKEADERRSEAEKEREKVKAALALVTQERDAKVRALRRAEGLYLAAHSERVREEDPGLALALAVEGLRRHRHVHTTSAVASALEACRELRTFRGHSGPLASASLSRDGKRVLTCGTDNTVRLWDAFSGQQLLVIKGPKSDGDPWTKLCVALLSPDGSRVLTLAAHGYCEDWWRSKHGGGYSPTYALWDAATGRQVTTWQLPPGDTISRTTPLIVGFSPDGKDVATTFGQTFSDLVTVRDAAMGKLRFRLEGHGDMVVCIAYSPDGRWIATASMWGKVCLWEAKTGRLARVLHGHTSGVTRAVFSPDSQRLLTLGDGCRPGGGGGGNSTCEDVPARIWNVATGKQVGALRWPEAECTHLFLARWSGDGKRILTAGQQGVCHMEGRGQPMVWDALSGRRLAICRGELGGPEMLWPDKIFSADISKDGRLVVAPARNGVQVWDAETGRQRFVLRGHKGVVGKVELSHDGTRLVSAGADGTARLWDVRPDRGTSSWSPRWQGLLPGEFSPDGQRLYLPAGVGPPSLLTWMVSTTSGKPLASWFGLCPRSTLCRLLGGDIYSLRSSSALFSPDGRHVAASAAYTVDLRDAATLRRRHELFVYYAGVFGPVSVGGYHIRSKTFSPDSRRLFTCDGHNGQLWDVATGKLLHELRHGFSIGVSAGAFSPDSRLLVTCGEDPWGGSAGWVREDRGQSGPGAHLWDVATGELLARLDLHGLRCHAVRFSPDGRLVVTASSDGTVWLWDVQSRKPRQRFKGHTAAALTASFSPDGQRLVTGSEDGTARIWNPQTCMQRVLKGHDGAVRKALFSPDGKTILTAGEDATVRLWDAVTGLALAILREPGLEVLSARFSSDGRWVLTTWKSPKGKPARGVSRMWPVNLLAVAEARRPRDRTAEERELYESGEVKELPAPAGSLVPPKKKGIQWERFSSTRP